MRKISFVFLVLGIFLVTSVSAGRVIMEKDVSGVNLMRVAGAVEDSKISVENNESEIEKYDGLGYHIVGEDKKVYAFLDEAVETVNVTSVWNLTVSGISLNGNRTAVCVIDTGVDLSHPDLADKVLAEYCFCSGNEGAATDCCPDGTSEDDNATDNNGHGTHVAGIVAASGGIEGVADGANIVAVKVLNSTGVGYDSDIKSAIEWCTADAQISAYNISVISLSLGGGQYTSEGSCVSVDAAGVRTAINAAVAKNISVVISTGNTYSGHLNPVAGISSPACLPNVTRVTATNSGDDGLASFAFRYSSFADILAAPGTSINSTLPTYSVDLNNYGYSQNYDSMSGTSMAAPMVSGAIAIIKQYFNLSSQLKNSSEVVNILNSTGKEITDSLTDSKYFRIDVYSALLSVDLTAPNVTGVSPANGSVGVSTNQTFSANFSDWQLKNVTFSLWNSTDLVNQTSWNISGETNSSSINLTNLTLGENYFYSYEVYDKKDNIFSSGNYSFSLEDLVVSLSSPNDGNYTNVNGTNFTCVSQSNESMELANVTFSLWNSTDLIWNLTEEISGFENSTIFNYTFSDDGNYSWGCEAVSNISVNYTSSNRTVVYDSVEPVVSLSSPSDSTSSTTKDWRFTYSVTDLNNDSCVLTLNDVDYSSFDQTLADGTYSWSVTCTDLAGNSGTSETRTLTIYTVSSSSSGGGGGGGSKTYSASQEEITSGYTKSLSTGDKIYLELVPARHVVTALSIGSDYAYLLIQSNPVRVNLSVGESERIDIGVFGKELLVELESVVSKKASVSVKLVDEIVEGNNESNPVFATSEGDSADSENEDSKDYSVWLVVGVILVLFFVLLNKKELKSRKTSKSRGKGKTSKAKS